MKKTYKIKNLSLYTSVILAAFCLNTLIHCGEKKGKAFISQMSRVQIDSMLAVNSNAGKTVAERMEMYSEMFLNMDYSWTSTGDGPYALQETWPLVNFGNTNCMVFCEHTLAMAISDGWDNFFNNLQHIRYRDGIIGMRTRNHYTMADWLPENSWILNDISGIIGGEDTVSVTRIISHENFFRGKGMTDMRHVLPDREITVTYIPLDKAVKTSTGLRTGDIGTVLFAEKEDIFSAHMFMITEKGGQKYIREATTNGMTTFETPLGIWVNEKILTEKYLGLTFMRVRDNLNIRDKIVLPWEIASLK